MGAWERPKAIPDNELRDSRPGFSGARSAGRALDAGTGVETAPGSEPDQAAEGASRRAGLARAPLEEGVSAATEARRAGRGGRVSAAIGAR